VDYVCCIPWGASIHSETYNTRRFCAFIQCRDGVRIPGTPFSFTPTTPTGAWNRRMTEANRGRPGDDTNCSASCEGETQCCGQDHHESDVSVEVESHCGDGCCADDEEDCQSTVDDCEGSCCGHDEDHSIVEESACEKDIPQGTDRIHFCIRNSKSVADTGPHHIRWVLPNRITYPKVGPFRPPQPSYERG